MPNLKDALRYQLTDEELACLVRSYDVVGDLVIIIIDEALVAKEHIIGEALLAMHKNVKVVLKRAGHYQGEFRQVPLKVIAGENRKTTICRENGVRISIGPEQAYYSVRSAAERKRIASQVRSGEDVLVMFSGVGPFPFVIANCSDAATVVGIEKNPQAHQFALANLVLNKKLQNISFYQGDVRDVLPGLDRHFDRIVMPLPKGADKFLELGLMNLRSNGQLHYYSILEKLHFAKAVDQVKQACDNMARRVKESQVVTAGHCGPGKYRICVDCVIE